MVRAQAMASPARMRGIMEDVREDDGSPPDSSEDFARFELLGRSPPFRRTLALVARIAASDATALIQGETGTGKELVARAVHYLGARASGPFLPVNCGAIPDELVENELFGHARGAYTDARDGHAGTVGEAAGGTLFLDEVETLSPRAQVALLRFLQDGTYRPLGGRSVVRSDARIVAASNADLRSLTRVGRFRSDLLYRLDVMPVHLPPLRARGSDALLLARHFLARFARKYSGTEPLVGSDAADALLSYSWPGNVRELENLMHRAFFFTDAGIVRLVRCAEAGLAPAGAEAPATWQDAACERHLSTAKAMLVGDFERTFLLRVLSESRGNVSEAARRCGKERRALGKLLKKHGIDRRTCLGQAASPGGAT